MKDLFVGGDERATAVRLEEHRAELTGYCYRMLGSLFTRRSVGGHPVDRTVPGQSGVRNR